MGRKTLFIVFIYLIETTKDVTCPATKNNLKHTLLLANFNWGLLCDNNWNEHEQNKHKQGENGAN